jgi:phosphohistidine phosphatase SixA
MDKDVMLVGHLPHLARLGALLLTGDMAKNVINFKMAGLVCLGRRADGSWALEWMISALIP